MTQHKEIKLVVTDLDGTLLDGNSALTEEAVAAVRALEARGIRFTLATGRMAPMTEVFARRLALKLPIIAYNGGMIREAGQGTIYDRHVLNDDVAARIYEQAKRRGWDLLIYTADEVYYFPGSRRIAFFHHYNQMAEEEGIPGVPLLLRDTLPAPGTAWRGEAMKFFIRYEPSEEDALYRFLENLPDIHLIRSAHGTVDVVPPGISKARAVRFLADRYGIPMEQVCTVGDQDNDADMLREAGLGMAVANAVPASLEAADVVIPAHTEEGFARGIRRYVLGDMD